MSVNKRRFPSNFPEKCPPTDAIEEEIEVYRLSNDNPPSKKDFLSHVLLYPKKKYNNMEAYGISVFSDYEEIEFMFALNPRTRNKFKHICKGITKDGVIKKGDKTTHITWWLYEGATPHSYFETIK